MAFQCTHTMGGPEPSLHRESTDSLIKPTHSGILLHYDSAHPTSTKNAMVYSQISKATRVLSTQAGSGRGAKEVVRMLERNGYPTSTLIKIQKRAFSVCTSHQNQGEMTHHDGVLCLPYISDALHYRVKRVVKRSGMNIHLVMKSGPTLKSILT